MNNNSFLFNKYNNTEKENTAPVTLAHSKSNSPFSLEKKGIKTTKSFNFKNFSSNLAFDQRQSPNLKLNRSKSPVINQRKHSKPDNISYNMMRKLKTDLEENPNNIKKTPNLKEISNSTNNLAKELNYKNSNNSKSISSLLVTKKISLNSEDNRKSYKIFSLGIKIKFTSLFIQNRGI